MEASGVVKSGDLELSKTRACDWAVSDVEHGNLWNE